MQTKKKNLYQSILFIFCLATSIYNTTCYAVIEKYLLYTTNNAGVVTGCTLIIDSVILKKDYQEIGPTLDQELKELISTKLLKMVTFNIQNNQSIQQIRERFLTNPTFSHFIDSNDNESNTLQPPSPGFIEETPHPNSPASDLNSTSSSSTQESSPPLHPVSPLFLSPNQSQIESTSFIISPTTSPNIPYPNENNPTSRETLHPNSPASDLNSTSPSLTQESSPPLLPASPFILSPHQSQMESNSSSISPTTLPKLVVIHIS